MEDNKNLTFAILLLVTQSKFVLPGDLYVKVKLSVKDLTQNVWAVLGIGGQVKILFKSQVRFWWQNNSTSELD